MDDRKLFIYMTTNIIDDKKYIGQHKGYEDDGYLGSGVRIVNAVKNMAKKILNVKLFVIVIRKKN